MNLAAIVATGVAIVLSVAVALRARRANRLLWAQLSSLETRFDRQTAESWEAQRAVHSAVARALTSVEDVRFHAQHGEDFFALHHSGWKRDGYFVEVGAYDGVALSNTKTLATLGWRGILIEANPEQAERCRLNRPESIVIHAAAGSSSAGGEIAFNRVVGERVGVLSFVEASAEHVQRCLREGGRLERVSVPIRTLAEVLSEVSPSQPIDLMTIDVEGVEFDVLRGMDWVRFAPRLLIVEDNEGKQEIAQYLGHLGYSLVSVLGCNSVYERR